MTRRSTFVVLIAGAVVLLLAEFYVNSVRQGELGEKVPGSVLQGVEITHRDDPDHLCVLLERNALGSGYTLLGVPSSNSAYPRVWIIVNATGPEGKIEFMPSVAFKLSCTYIDDLRSKVTVDPAVLSFLKARCS
jgi:hypothetical protein